jgi:hypothetical protein
MTNKLKETTTSLSPTGGAPLPADIATVAAADCGLGIADQSEDFIFPLLKTAQALSPALDPNDPGYVPGLKPGFFYITGTGFMSETVLAIFVAQLHPFIEWLPGRGGFVERHSKCPGDVAEHKPENGARRPVLVRPNGNVITEVRELYLLANDVPCMQSCAGSFHRFARGLQSQFASYLHPQTKKPMPSFARRYELRTVQTKNALGRWFVPIVCSSEWVSRAEYDRAKTFRELVDGGRVRVAQDPDEIGAAAS